MTVEPNPSGLEIPDTTQELPEPMSPEEFLRHVAMLHGTQPRDEPRHWRDDVAARIAWDRQSLVARLDAYKELARAAEHLGRAWRGDPPESISVLMAEEFLPALSRLPAPTEEEQGCTIYQTTWTTPHGAMADGIGPDLNKPCARCGRPLKDHARMSLTPATEEEQE